jgi:hypothetical protein
MFTEDICISRAIELNRINECCEKKKDGEVSETMEILLYPPSPGQPVSLKPQTQLVRKMTRACHPLLFAVFSHDILFEQDNQSLGVNSVLARSSRVGCMFYLLIGMPRQKHNLPHRVFVSESIRWSTRHDSHYGNGIQSFSFPDKIIQRDDNWMTQLPRLQG